VAPIGAVDDPDLTRVTPASYVWTFVLAFTVELASGQPTGSASVSSR